jgi:hypothetical protein
MKMLEHGMAHLKSMSMNFLQMTFTVRDVQRCWLEITALLNYMIIFKPCMDSPSIHAPSHPVASMGGVFTSGVHVAQDFFHARLLCWLIQPASVWSDINILKVVPLVTPENHLHLELHPIYCPPVYVGPASAPEKHHAMLRFAHGFLRYPDPFSIAINGEDARLMAFSAFSHATSLFAGATTSSTTSATTLTATASLM